MPTDRLRRALPALLLLALTTRSATAPAAQPKVPEGFEVRLVATVPAVLYPCQVATAPGGVLFVAEDPMDQVGPYESSHGRILRFEDDDPRPFAEGFRAIQGMAWRDGALYVCHMPFLTVVRDADGDGKADTRDDLFKDLGPTDNRGLNDHIVSGIQFGIDGMLYISVGDKGVPGATRPEDGETVRLKGGGTLRCRPDGTGLEVFSSGTRNHLEANLDDRDDLFTYDNTDDGDGWWTRVTHHIDGGYYGYPYDYHDRPDRFLPRMAEYGGGSPCGAAFYKEDAWPEAWRNVGLWAEWGKGKVHAFKFRPRGASFEVAEPIDFAVPDGVENFRPIDLAVSYDGKTLYVADWGMGGWGSKTEKVGRVYAITYKGEVETRPRGSDSDPIADQIRQLDHPSYNERTRAQLALIKEGGEALGPVTAALDDPGVPALAKRHLLWALVGIAGRSPESAQPLMKSLKSPEADLRAQSARALGELEAPIAVGPLIEALKDAGPTVRLHAAIALGRIGHKEAIPALLPMLADEDVYLSFAARVALRRINDWKAAAEGLKSSDAKVRAGVMAAMELQYESDAAEALAGFVKDRDRPATERARALMYLAQGHRKAKPWDGKWWGTRPTQGKPPAKEVDWDGTPLVLATIRDGLDDAEVPVRVEAVAAVKEANDREALPILRQRFADEPDEAARREVALALGAMGDEEALPILTAALRDPDDPEPVREAALTAVEAIGGGLATNALIDLLKRADVASDRLPLVIAALGKFKATEAVEPLLASLSSDSAKVRAASAEALGRIGRTEGVAEEVRGLLDDGDLDVRKAAIAASAALKDREAVPGLLAAADRPETRFEATMALASVSDVKALQIYLRGLTDKNQDLRKATAGAIAKIRDEAAPILDRLAERRELPPSAIAELQKVYTRLVPIDSWRVVGPFKLDGSPEVKPEAVDTAATLTDAEGKPATWKLVKADDDEGRVELNKTYGYGRLSAYGYAEVQSPKARKAQVVVGSDDTLTVWVNDEQVYDFRGDRGFGHDQDRFDVDLVEGTNRVLIHCANHGGGWQFGVRIASEAEHAFLRAPAAGAFNPDEFREFALSQKGDPEKGRALFADLKGLACVKCHAVAGQGGAVGPDLAGVGARYPRDDLIQSVLFPSAKIFSGYEPVTVVTTDGRILTGIVKNDGDALEIEDADAKRIRIPKDEIEARKPSDVSLMPNGLAEGLDPRDFADLISYLETLREAPAKGEGK